ncbi:MAG: hypothetical protein R3E77_11800 [Steroidobacteraceae bacterium]
MSEYKIWVFIHILLFVYWLGADLGVFLLARVARTASLSFAERAFSLKMALVIDTTPRICFALMFPVGLALCDAGGYVDIPAVWQALAWLIAATWIVLLVQLGKSAGTARAERLNRLHLAFQALAMLGIGGAGVASLLGSGPFPPAWLALKVTLFATIFALAIGIDHAFRPVAPAFARLAVEGSKPEIETDISAGINSAIRYVLALYATLLIIAFLGVTKSF